VSNENIISQYNGTIYLYGEKHGDEKIINREYIIWKAYYNEGLRHLFVELPYYTAKYLNLWMTDKDDSKLNEIYTDWKGSAAYNINTLEFYKKIKASCPETIFHGTDIGHQYLSTGKRYLNYLENNCLINSKEYSITKKIIEQGEYYYCSNNKNSEIYRENKMVENFIREINTINNENIMGIYGSAHTAIDKLDFSKSIPCMGNQLNSLYKGKVVSFDLSK